MRSGRGLIQALLLFLSGSAAMAVPPVPDHVVIVVEENHSYTEIIGSPEAPYVNSLASTGASFTNFYAVSHPSQPNYLHLFSGSHQGSFNDTVPPAGAPFVTANLGAALLTAGKSFVGYSEDLPAVGSTVSSSGDYYRKHNPWVDWQNSPQGTNQLPPTINKPFFTGGGAPFYGDASAPTDYGALPQVCFVVPNQLNDMHDGTIAQADTWLVNYIKPYADWAVHHNSLLIITFDEDDDTLRNRIATIFYGPMITPGQYAATWTLHNLLRTIEDMHGTAHSGNAAKVRPIVGCFTSDVPTATRTFRQGLNGYSDAHDTWIEQANPNTAHGTSTVLVIDGSPFSQGLIRFDNIIGSGPAQIPQGVTVLSAKLNILTGPNSATNDSSLNTMSGYRMLVPWSETDTWNTLAGGVATDGSEAATTSDFGVIPNVLNAWAIFDVTDTAQIFAINPGANYGWLLQPSGTDGWRSVSSEATVLGDRPTLEITYDPTSCRGIVAQQPVGRHVIVGGTVVLSVGATATNPLSYQWRKDGTNISDGGAISGATTDTLTISPVGLADAGAYDVVLTNACGAVTSAAANLIVCPQSPNGDMNGDRYVDGTDIAPFVTAVLAGSVSTVDVCPGDFSLNSIVDLDDAPSFVSALLAP